jgi:tetratricopeptide (TPR) repeat protein
MNAIFFIIKAYFSNKQLTFLAIMTLALLASCARHHKTPRKFDQDIMAQTSEASNPAQELIHINKSLSKKSSPQLLALKANLLYQLNRLQESKKTYELALKDKDILAELRADILNNYAVILTKIGEHQTAQTLWWQLTKNNSYRTPEVAWFNLGLSAWHECTTMQCDTPTQAQKKARIALSRFSNALALEPEYIDALFFKAQAELVCDKKKDGRHSLHKILVIAPTHQSAAQLLNTI